MAFCEADYPAGFPSAIIRLPFETRANHRISRSSSQALAGADLRTHQLYEAKREGTLRIEAFGTRADPVAAVMWTKKPDLANMYHLP